MTIDKAMILVVADINPDFKYPEYEVFAMYDETVKCWTDRDGDVVDIFGYDTMMQIDYYPSTIEGPEVKS